MTNRVVRLLRWVLINALVLVFLLVMLEGIAGYTLLAYDFLFRSIRPVAERVHTEYDPELGWINLPNVFIEDMYGPDTRLTTNSQRFRNDTDFAVEVQGGQLRILCSGDSYTLGYGVSDQQTWCHLLSTMDDRIETVNLGQGGYGVDQAYLWYKRNEPKLHHDILLFTFVSVDFLRMKSDSFLGYGKPYLTVQKGTLVQENLPVSRSSYRFPLQRSVLTRVSTLKTMNLLNGLRQRWSTGNKAGDEMTQAVSSQIFEELDRISRENDRSFVLVYLPTANDYLKRAGESDMDSWRAFVRAQAADNSYLLIDVVEELRKIAPDVGEGLYNAADGHLSVEGNRQVMEIIYKRLFELPEVSARLNSQ